ncbi:GNAT family N-acetyltransferase [Chloroflexota bacterium]
MDIIYRKAIPLKDDKEILSVYNEAHGQELTMEWFKWYNYTCPYGANRLCVAEDRDTSRIAAVWGMLPLRVKLNDKIVNGSFASNATTHPDYQHKGIFTELNKFVQSQEKQHDVKVSVGIFGENDIWGMKHLGWEILGDLEFIACYNTTGIEVPRIIEVNRFTKEFDWLMLESYRKTRFSFFKTHEFLNWRYFDRPDQQYHVYAYRTEDKLSGFSVLKYFEENGYKKAHILDMYFLNENTFDVLIGISKNFSVAGGCHVLNCWQAKYSPYLEWFFQRGFEPTTHRQVLKSNLGPIEKLPKHDWWFMLGGYDVY